MKYNTTEEALERLLTYFKVYYNITRYEADKFPLTALCEFYEHSQKYVLSRKAELWSEDSEEFVYLFQVSHLTLDLFQKMKEYAYEDGMKRLHIGPGHMCSVINPIILCNTCDKDAIREIKKCRIYKSFHFSLHGWMDFHTVLIQRGESDFPTNRSGKSNAKFMKNIFMKKVRRKKGA